MLLALATLLLAAGVQRAWNSASIPPLLGYDVPGHVGYLHTLAMDARIPHPFEGWSTFHPPLYYLVGAATWRALAPLGPQAVLLGLRSLGELAGLAAGLVAFFGA